MSLNEEIEKDVLPWLDLAEGLRDLQLEATLQVPQICVMGDQSSGKSSVLEALSGIPFPRGTGLVTRCPIRLVMKKAKEGSEWSAVAYTSLKPERYRIVSPEKLPDVINQLTAILCPNGAQFSSESIIIELVSPDAYDLTVVDLPGIIRTVTVGQDPTEIANVNRLIKQYLTEERTIILAVIPANQDIATIEILERARDVDPSGLRTIGVLTKVDLVGAGNEDEVISVVQNIRKPLALGYIMVRNRSQKDLNEQISMMKAREQETQFFKSHPAFKTCYPKYCGTYQLAKRLTSILVHRIKTQLAPMRSIVDKQLSEVRSWLRSKTNLGPNKTANDRQKLLITVMQEYSRHLTDAIRGEYRDRVMVQHAELRLCTQVFGVFDQFKIQIQDTVPKFKDDQFIHNLSIQIDQLRGRELPGFLSFQAFSMCMAQYLDLWKVPLKEMLRQVSQIVQAVCQEMAGVLFPQYSQLKQALTEVAARVIFDISSKTWTRLEAIYQFEKDPFTFNDFLQSWTNNIRLKKFYAAVDSQFASAATPASNWNGLKEEIRNQLGRWYRTTHSVSIMADAQEMSIIMEAYWGLSVKRFVDHCCLVVDREFLGELVKNVKESLYDWVKQDEKLEEFFAENMDSIQKREDHEKRKEKLIKASIILSNIQSQIQQ